MGLPITVQEFIRWGASRFEHAGLVFGHGTDNPLDESAAMVLHALELGFEPSADDLNRELTAPERQRITGLIEARITTRKPAAYLIREAWFAGLALYVDERVLVPRSPIAELIENGFSPWVVPDQVGAILDLCTGSGCIGIACACAFPDARVVATDISADALAVARINVARHAMRQRVTLRQTSLFDGLGEERFDIIVSNPPYVPHREVGQLPAEYQHEPAVGLAAGDQGLDIVIRILALAADYLGENGILVVEVGDSQQALIRQFPQVPFCWLEFACGGEGVFLLERRQLLEFQPEFARLAARSPGTGATHNEVS